MIDQFCPGCGQSPYIHPDGPLLRCGACGREWPTMEEVERLREVPGRMIEAIEAKARAVRAVAKAMGGFYAQYEDQGRTSITADVWDAAARLARETSGEPAPTPTPSILDAIAAIRAAGGSDWDRIPDVAAFLGRDDPPRDVVPEPL